MHCRIIYRTYIAQDTHTRTHTHTSHFYSHFLSFHKWYRHHIFFYFFLPKREECTFKFAKFSVENPAATFCFGSIVMIIIVASCVSVCIGITLSIRHDNHILSITVATVAFTHLCSVASIFYHLIGLVHVLFSFSRLLSLHGFVRSHWMSIKKICMWAHTWWCPSTFHYVRARVCVCVLCLFIKL